jgi:hypothetical protein
VSKNFSFDGVAENMVQLRQSFGVSNIRLADCESESGGGGLICFGHFHKGALLKNLPSRSRGSD